MVARVDDGARTFQPFARIARFIGRPVRALGSRKSRFKSTSARSVSALPASAPAPASPLQPFALPHPRELQFWTLDQHNRLRMALQQGLKPLQQQLASLLAAGASASAAGASGFPAQVAPVLEANARPASLAPPRQPQELTTTGSKLWGESGKWWDGRGLLHVKVYDFAIYTNRAHLTAAPLHRAEPAAASPTPSPARSRWLRRGAPDRAADDDAPLCRDVGGEASVEMCLTVRPARDLPLPLMRSEYKRILQKRMRAIGGDPDDPALHALMAYFDAAALPAAVTHNGCIRKGTTLHFARSRRGALTATAAGTPLTTVSSPKLCEAVFDLYLGAEPVCRKARAEADATLQRMLQPSRMPHI